MSSRKESGTGDIRDDYKLGEVFDASLAEQQAMITRSREGMDRDIGVKESTVAIEVVEAFHGLSLGERVWVTRQLGLRTIEALQLP